MRSLHRAALGLGLLAGGCDSAQAGADTSAPVAFVSASPVDIDYALPDFDLVDQRGQRVTRADLSGKVLVVDFIFTRCPTVCPRLTERMAVVQKELASDADVRLVSITVDPEHDTPDTLAAYGAKYGADPARWYFLGGDPEHVQKTVLQGFKMAVRRVSAESIDHAERFVLVDRAMHVRGVFETDDAAIASLVARARELLAVKAP